ncbi:hypothetical protein Hanom_Chr07g00649611 [Helianthus anomalus]
MIKSKKADSIFKLNFLILYNSLLGETTKSSIVNKRFLKAITDDSTIRNLNWCNYMITCLKRTKEEWNGVKPYHRPLTFLAVCLYMNIYNTSHLPISQKHLTNIY